MDVRNVRDRAQDYLQVNDYHGLMTSPDFLVRVALGKIPGATIARGLGINYNITSVTVPQDIWNVGGLHPWMPAAAALQMKSTDANDSAAGTGGRTYRVIGLDANYVAQTEDVTLNGTTWVALTKQWLRINLITQLSAGSNEVNLGTIDLQRTSDNLAVGRVMPGIGQSESSAYTVAAGHTLLVASGDAEIGQGQGQQVRFADVRLVFRSSTGSLRMPRRISTLDRAPRVISPHTFFNVPEKSDFVLRCPYTSDTSVTSLTGAWEGVLFDNTVNW